ncbi:MAG: DnaK suppressor protein [Blastocatellia bacterium]|jgi:DnaK suppressor protein|nr:DnaK suppressor protein [Blastocatellia bacterium]
MDSKRLEHFKNILLTQLRTLTEQVTDDRAAAIDSADGDAKDVVDKSQQDVNQELALKLGERASKMIAEIDQALLRIEEGSYGTCDRCGKEIDERRLEAVPTARYDAACQEAIESEDGTDEHISTL